MKKIECNDKNCPFHGNLKVRGRLLSGKIIKIYGRTGTLERGYSIYLSKYERYEQRRSRIKVHIPACVDIKVGDNVKIGETRPISKTKNFVVVEKK